jgi:adenylate cyclase
VSDNGLLSTREAARHVGVTPATLKRWAETGVIPERRGDEEGWTPSAVAHARIVARLRERGFSLDDVRRAGEEGRLAYGYLEGLFSPHGEATIPFDEAAEEVGLEPALLERVWASVGFAPRRPEHLSHDDMRALRYISAVLAAGFPLVAFIQLIRVYGQALSRIADAETRLFHIYVHEPLMRQGVPGLQMAEEMENLAGDLLPFSSPLMDYLHQRFLREFVERDVIGHMEADLDESIDLGRVRVGIAFADLAGWTRFTEEVGEEEALDVVESFIESVTETLPEGARVIKTIGDEVMIIGQDGGELTDWAVGFQRLWQDRPLARIGIHNGVTLYRDGDYYGRDVNLAARVVARARGGEVLVSGAVMDSIEDDGHLRFDNIGQVKLKGFDDPVQLCRPVPEE